MDAKELAKIKEELEYQKLTVLIQQAAIESLLQVIQTLRPDNDAKAAIVELFRRWKIKHLEEILIMVEDSDPALAARLQQKIDESKGRTGG